MIPARLYQEVLALPPEERREFALKVLETVEDREPSLDEIEEAQYQECLRRLKDLEEGREELIPGDVVEAEIREKLARARRAQAG